MNTSLNIDHASVSRVRDKLPIPTKCHLCDGAVELVSHVQVYGESYGNWPWLYRCNNCHAAVGLHPHTDIPLGTLADRRTRGARQAAKKLFQQWRKEKGYDRNLAYATLADALEMEKRHCHFGWFRYEMCIRAMRFLMTELENK